MKRKSLTVALALLMVAPSVSYATNGYLLHGYGKNKGLAGAGSANPQDALAAATNPAGTVWVGDRVDIYGELFAPRRGYDFDDTGNGINDGSDNIDAGGVFADLGIQDKVNSEKDVFLIPSFGFTRTIDDVSAWGVSVYGAGLGTEFSRNDTSSPNIAGVPIVGDALQDGTFLDGSTGVDLLLLLSNINYSRKITENSSWGVGLILAAQSFKAKGLGNFGLLSSDSANLTDRGRDWAFGYGATVGFQAEVIDGLTIAASYQTEIGLEHEKYRGLFAGNGDFSLPRQWVLGLTYKPNHSSAFSFDIQRIYWSEISSTGNNFEAFVNDGNGNLTFNELGDGDGAGFGFQDSTVFKFGYQWQMAILPKWTWRVGYSYQDQIIPTTETLFASLAPATIQEHFTLGFTKELDSGNELTFNALYAPQAKVRGSGVSEGVDIALEEYALELGYAWKWD